MGNGVDMTVRGKTFIFRHDTHVDMIFTASKRGVIEASKLFKEKFGYKNFILEGVLYDECDEVVKRSRGMFARRGRRPIGPQRCAARRRNGRSGS